MPDVHRIGFTQLSSNEAASGGPYRVKYASPDPANPYM